MARLGRAAIVARLVLVVAVVAGAAFLYERFGGGGGDPFRSLPTPEKSDGGGKPGFFDRLTGAGEPRVADGAERKARVASVIDGDTVVLDDGATIRYIGIDTPEKDERFFEEAALANRLLVEGRDVRVVECAARPIDKYGRRLARVTADDIDVTHELLAAGLGAPFLDSECLGREALDEYVDASIDAWSRGEGLFAGRAGEVVSADKSNRAIGDLAMVCGRVRSVHRSEKVTHLNFGADWKSDFTVTIFARDVPLLAKSARLDDLRGREVVVFGKVRSRNGPDIIVTAPRQLRAVESCSNVK
ncbi:thermonuclease family protein [bacterium]|nr:thermonuclease family protein [bacterium]